MFDYIGVNLSFWYECSTTILLICVIITIQYMSLVFMSICMFNEWLIWDISIHYNILVYCINLYIFDSIFNSIKPGFYENLLIYDQLYILTSDWLCIYICYILLIFYLSSIHLLTVFYELFGNYSIDGLLQSLYITLINYYIQDSARLLFLLTFIHLTTQSYLYWISYSSLIIILLLLVTIPFSLIVVISMWLFLFNML